MNITKQTSTGIALLGIITAFILFGNDASAQERGRRHQGPPPEAYTACEGKSVGDTAEFESPRGDIVTGTCEQEGERLVLRPDFPSTKNNNNNKHQGPPREAYTACKGKNVGDSAEFVDPRGATMSGICEQENDQLVLRPTRPERNSDD